MGGGYGWVGCDWLRVHFGFKLIDRIVKEYKIKLLINNQPVNNILFPSFKEIEDDICNLNFSEMCFLGFRFNFQEYTTFCEWIPI